MMQIRYKRWVLGIGLAILAVIVARTLLRDVPPPTGQVAFIGESNNSADIYVMQTDGSRLTQLSHPNTEQHLRWPPDLRWSPDGTHLAFLSDGPADIHVMRADGSNQTVLTQGMPVHELTWSPDSQKIAFFGPDLFVVRPDGLQLTRLTSVALESVYSQLSWSPIGQRMAFVVRSAATGTGAAAFIEVLYIIDAGGTNLRALTQGLAISSFAWSPDGQRIVFAGYDPAITTEMDIYRINVDGTDLTQLTKRPGIEWLPSWSPDGQQIVFVAEDPDAGADIMVMDILGTHQTAVARQRASGPQLAPVWSADSQWIIFAETAAIPQPSGWRKRLSDVLCPHISAACVAPVPSEGYRGIISAVKDDGSAMQVLTASQDRVYGWLTIR